MHKPQVLKTQLGLLALAALTTLAGCGGGEPLAAEPEATAADAAADADAPGRKQAQALDLSQRVAAVTATAQSTSNACNTARPFYWEIGDRDARRASGSVAGTGTTITGSTVLSVASASKWLYGTYVAERRAGVLTETDRRHLSMRAGYTNFRVCDPRQTVDSCLSWQGNGDYDATLDGVFYYNGGHMQRHASQLGLGAMNLMALKTEFKRVLGSDVPLNFVQPQLAAGMAISADGYAHVLRKMLGGQLKMGALLGTGKVCTNPLECGLDEAMLTPVPQGERWHYSVGHWVEDDPVVGDGAFSSGGAFGFYPWIDAGRSWYGVVARNAKNDSLPSVYCGRLLRQAWAAGVAQ
jgi:predicted small lipoprotein YifL